MENCLESALETRANAATKTDLVVPVAPVSEVSAMDFWETVWVMSVSCGWAVAYYICLGIAFVCRCRNAANEKGPRHEATIFHQY